MKSDKSVPALLKEKTTSLPRTNSTMTPQMLTREPKEKKKETQLLH